MLSRMFVLLFQRAQFKITGKLMVIGVDQQIRQRLSTKTLLPRLQRLRNAETLHRALPLAASTVEPTADENGC